ncbi:hypothetical protein [Rhizobium ruizarguesonis]|nr:hypothetical protein [Rhizobium ruizarguesonis]
MFGFRVDLAGGNLRHQVVLGGSQKLVLHDVDHIHRSHDVGD